MKKKTYQHLEPSKLALSATTIVSTTTIFATFTALMTNFKTITPILQSLYGPIGYSVSTTGAIIGAIYAGVDIFILTFLFAWLYNKLL